MVPVTQTVEALRFGFRVEVSPVLPVSDGCGLFFSDINAHDLDVVTQVETSIGDDGGLAG